ncbi:MAG: uracil-DNA glycosylase, partial [bacterium]
TRLIDADFRISKQHGRITERDGIHYMALYHPSALLRDPSKRPGTFVDLKSLQFLMRRLGIKYYE